MFKTKGTFAITLAYFSEVIEYKEIIFTAQTRGPAVSLRAGASYRYLQLFFAPGVEQRLESVRDIII
jgi:hypothetical protein